MATTYLYLTGIAYWAKLYPENVDVYEDRKNAQIVLALEPDQIKALKNAGSQVNININDEGKMTVKFRRYIDHKIKELGGYPVIIDAEGAPMKALIGNGSKVTVKVSVYDANKGRGTRLESVRVDDLVEYIAPVEREASTETQFLVGVPF